MTEKEALFLCVMTSQRSSMRLTRLSGRKKGFSENFVELHLMKKETGMDFIMNFI